MKAIHLGRTVLAVIVMLAASARAQDIPAGPGFVYQGVLTLQGQPVTEPILIAFELYPDPDALGEPVAPEIQQLVEPDEHGRFGVELDFGTVFDGGERYLRITLLETPSGQPGPITLAPLTKITAAPMAAYALDARVPSLAEVTEGRADSVDGGFLEIEAAADFTRGILLRSTPDDTVFAVPGIRAVENFTIESTTGNLAFNAGLGRIDLTSQESINLTAGSSLITLGAAGIDLSSLALELISDTSITIEAGLGTTVEGLLTTIRGNAQLRLDGGVILLDGNTIINGHQFIEDNAQVTGTLQVTANAFKPGGGLWGVLSDARTKTHIAPLSGSLDTVRALRPVRFEYNNPSHPLYVPGVQHGFVAQHVRTVRPDWVSVGEDGALMLAPRGFEALMVDALQELESSHRREIDALRAENDQLRTRLDRLEALLLSSQPGR